MEAAGGLARKQQGEPAQAGKPGRGDRKTAGFLRLFAHPPLSDHFLSNP